VATLLDLVSRSPVAEPWQEGDNLPWDDLEFSQRMLAEHLSQEHDAASRRASTIEAQVGWIHQEVLGGQRTRLLDLCCGPGLHTSRLAALGHECVGIDFSPAAITYAREHAAAEQLACRYVREDVRLAEFGTGFGLAMMVFGQLNVFRPAEARALLVKARGALAAGGVLLLEVHTLAAVEGLGRAGRSWYSAAQGLFSPRPHLLLEESFWQTSLQAAVTRFLVLDAASGEVTRHALTTQGYSTDQYQSLLTEAGFAEVQCLPSLTGREDPTSRELFVLKARASGRAGP
jgi:SAM-dependent methyltransferase